MRKVTEWLKGAVLGLAALLAGWSDELRTSFAPDYQVALKRFPGLAQVPVVGRHSPDSFSVERTLALRPDLVVMTWMGAAAAAPDRQARASGRARRKFRKRDMVFISGEAQEAGAQSPSISTWDSPREQVSTRASTW